MSYLKFPQYPNLPEDIKTEILDIINQQDFYSFDDLLVKSTEETTKTVNELYGFSAEESPLGYHGGIARTKFKTLVNYHFLDVSEKIRKWVEENITVSIASINIQIMEKGSSVAPHIDEVRTNAINYLIETGGDVDLVFYELINEDDKKYLHPQIFIPYEKLEIKEINRVKTDVWHTLPCSKIHSVENIDPTKRRISLSISVI